MANVEVTVPDLGVEDAVEVIEICVELGQTIAQEDPVAVLESDKATMEIPSDGEGKVTEILISVGDKVAQGDKLLILQSSSSASDDQKEDEESADQNAGQGQEESEASPPHESPEAKAAEKSADLKSQSEQLDVVVPDIGGAEQVEVIEVSVSEGDEVEQEQTLLVLESDKATMEIPSPAAGKISALKVKEGDKVAEGDLIALMMRSVSEEQAPSKESASSTPKTKESRAETPVSPSQRNESSISRQEPEGQAVSNDRAHAGPAVRKLARELGLDLTLVEGSGRKGRVLKEDVKAYVKSRLSGQAPGTSNVPVQHIPLPDFSAFGDVNVVAMDKMQKVTALNMQNSWASVPHVTQFDEADITDLEAFRKSKKNEAEKLGLKLTPLPFILKACAHALEKYPQFNVSIDMQAQTLIEKKYIHIGFAVDTPAGLVVPVIRDVNLKSVWQLAEECLALAAKARDRKLKPADMQGGCFTVSSLGSVGGTAFTPIVNAPEVAILGVSKADYQAKYNGSEFEPRLMLPLSLSYDHRAVNGVDGARFTAHIATVLADLRELLF